MSGLPSQDISYTYAFSVESFVFVSPFDNDGSVELNSRIETPRLEICEHRTTFFVSYKYHTPLHIVNLLGLLPHAVVFQHAPNTNGACHRTDLAPKGCPDLGERIEGLAVVDDHHTVVDVDPNQKPQTCSV